MVPLSPSRLYPRRGVFYHRTDQHLRRVVLACCRHGHCPGGRQVVRGRGALPTLRWGPLKVALIAMVAVLMGLNAVGAFGFLSWAHIEHAVAGDVLAVAGKVDIDARLAVHASTVNDLDRRIAQDRRCR